MKVDFIYFDAGGGHRAAATALRQVIEQQGRRFEIRMVNLQEVLDEVDVFRKATGLRLQDVYNLMLKKGWTIGSPQLMVGMHGVIRLFHRKTVRLLENFWRARRPDMVVSLVPNLDRALCESLRKARPGAPFVTILTDIADYPPHFWMEKQVQHFICGSSKAVEQARGLGHADDKIHPVSGMILNPRFYEIAPLAEEERAAERVKLGFDAGQPVGLMLFGGEGSSVMREVAARLNDRQLLVICGKNERLRQHLQGLPHGAPMFVEGFTKDVPRYMQLADYFIGKPGPGSVSEAIAMRLPVIVECNAWTLPQERYNAEWIKEMGVGIVLPNFRGVAEAVNQLLDPAAYLRFREATGRMRNRAVFEIPDILEQIAGEADEGGRPAALS
ncbi:MAG: glycosyltransferase [Candidatus Solibacter sp.]